MKFKFKKTDIHQWHKKFAWLPTYVQDSDDQNTYVWFEKYMRKRYGRSGWYRYSQKEWFKKKLAGEFDEVKLSGDEVFIGSSSVSTITAGGGLTNPGPTYTFTYDRDGGTGMVTGATVVTDVAESVDNAQIELDFGEDDFTVEGYVDLGLERNYEE